MTKFKVWYKSAVIGALKAVNSDEALEMARAGKFFVNRGFSEWEKNRDILTVTKF